MKRHGPYMVMDDDTDVSELMMPPSLGVLAWLDNMPPEEAIIAREVNARLSRQNLIQQLIAAAAAQDLFQYHDQTLIPNCNDSTL